MQGLPTGLDLPRVKNTELLTIGYIPTTSKLVPNFFFPSYDKGFPQTPYEPSI